MKYFGMNAGYDAQGPDVFSPPTSHDGGVFSYQPVDSKKQPQPASAASKGDVTPKATKNAA